MTGTAKLTLTITTNAKRGKRTVKHTTVYTVRRVESDPRVAHPAWELKKEGSTEVYHVAIEPYGPSCSCPAATFRGSNERIPCKHISALLAIKLL